MNPRDIPHILMCKNCNTYPTFKRRGRYEQDVDIDSYGTLVLKSNIIVATSAFRIHCPKCGQSKTADSARAVVIHWNKSYGKEGDK